MVARYASDAVDIAPLGRPLQFTFSGKAAQNRFLKAAMTERLSSWSPTDLSVRGVPSPELINVYKRWGEGGFGVILTGNVMIAPDQLEAAGNPIVPAGAPHSGERFEAFAAMATAAKAHGSLVVAQVSHPGRQTDRDLQPHPISASDVQLEGEVLGMKFAKPRAATTEELAAIVQRWTDVAVYLAEAGFDGVQLHGAHGYLLAQFLAPSTNKRTDRYGGSLENRARLITEIAQSIRRRLPASSGFVLGIKINSVEFQAGGFSTDEATRLCRLLEQNEFDFVELSGGTYESLGFHNKRASTISRESFFLDFAAEIVPGLTRTKTYVTGGFKTAGAMVRALETVDGVGLGRPATQEFHLPRDILSGEVRAAIEQRLDQNDFTITNIAAGTQIRQVGKDEEPLDLSDEKNVETFRESVDVWGEKMKRDAADMTLYGYVDLPQGQPYIA